MGSAAASHRRSLRPTAAAGPATAAASFEGERTVGLAVIGGGITGCTAAPTAAEAGASTVRREGMTIGRGASGRNGGEVVPELKDDPSELRVRDTGECR